MKGGALGWTYRSREEILILRGHDEREVLLLPTLREKLKQLNPSVLTSEARVDAIITKLRACRDNQQWIRWMRNGVNHQFDPAEKARDVRLVDFEHPENNGNTEGFHRKMKLLQRRAYDFRNFHNSRLRVIAHCG